MQFLGLLHRIIITLARKDEIGPLSNKVNWAFLPEDE